MLQLPVVSPSNEISLQSGRALEQINKLSELATLLPKNKRNTQQETQNTRDTKLVTNTSKSILKSLGLHQFLIFVTFDSCKHIGNTCTDECAPSKV